MLKWVGLYGNLHADGWLDVGNTKKRFRRSFRINGNSVNGASIQEDVTVADELTTETQLFKTNF